MHKKIARYLYFILFLVLISPPLNCATVEQGGILQQEEQEFLGQEITPSRTGKKIIDVKAEASPFKLLFTGYVKAESYFDTRQIVSARNRQFLLWPAQRLPDINGNDINAHSEFAMVALETRGTVQVNGPKVWGAKTAALIEGDFLGKTDETMNSLRLRHAFIRWQWDRTQFFAGQYWHPMVVQEASPDTISINSGCPTDPFARSPQLRVEHRVTDNITVIGTLAAQLDNVSAGPGKDNSVIFNSRFFINATCPNINLRAQATVGKHIFGVATDFKRLVPRLVTDSNYITNESINSFAAMAFATFKTDHFTCRNKLTWAQNGTDFFMISGYGVSALDQTTDRRCYTNTSAWAFWNDSAYTLKKVQLGLFTGYTKNLGSSKPLYKKTIASDADPNSAFIIYNLIDPNIDYVFRVSPRVRWLISPVNLGAELEYTRAAFGTITDCGKITNACPVGNLRLLFAFYYYF